MRFLIIGFLFFLSVVAQAEDALPVYEVGAGGQYNMKTNGADTDVTIAIVESSPKLLVVEMQMESDQSSVMAMPVQMTQQFHLGLKNGKMSILKGIMKIPNIENPQLLPPEFLQGFDGVKMQNFLINTRSGFDANKVGELKMKAQDGKTYNATHYKQAGNAQTVQYWISDELKPLGILKVESSGKKPDHNYKMVFLKSVKGYKRKIDPKTAVPLNEMAKMFLPLLGASTPFN